jgi:hypothetical protein
MIYLVYTVNMQDGSFILNCIGQVEASSDMESLAKALELFPDVDYLATTAQWTLKPGWSPEDQQKWKWKAEEKHMIMSISNGVKLNKDASAQRIRRVDFHAAVFGGTNQGKLMAELLDRMTGCPEYVTLDLWYNVNAAVVQVYLWHPSFDLIQPGQLIPYDLKIKLKPIGMKPVEPVKSWRDRAIADPTFTQDFFD